MVTIGKKAHLASMPRFKVSIEKKCGDCVGFNGCDWCNTNKHATNSVNYGCNSHMTKEQFEKKMQEMQAYLDSEDGVRVNYMLTLMYAMVSASYQIMVRGESMLGKLIGGKDWRFERKKALSDIMKDIKHIRSLYSTYFEKDYVQMLSEYGREKFDHCNYDGFQMFSGDFLMLGLTVFEHCYHNHEILFEIIDDIRKRPHDLNLFLPDFVETFRIKQ